MFFLVCLILSVNECLIKDFYTMNSRVSLTALCVAACLTLAASEDGCIDKNEQCPGWAKSGECQANPVYMIYSCRLSCQKCKDGTCKNLYDDDKCDRWAQGGECTQSFDWMSTNCAMSCGTGPCSVRSHNSINPKNFPENCADKEELCFIWSKSGECEANPSYMLFSCRRSCRSCDQGLQIWREGNPRVVERSSTIQSVVGSILGPTSPTSIVALTTNHIEACYQARYGCCPDGQTFAIGFFNKGCPSIEAGCSKTTFGCCPDGTTPANGPNNKGCSTDDEGCSKTVFGCCPDGKTTAIGRNNKGCSSVNSGCSSTAYGCCLDGLTPASGHFNKGCPSNDGGCISSTYGCCPDSKTPANGTNNKGCPSGEADCRKTSFGCCQDGKTPANGTNNKGCPSGESDCRKTTFGCCPDGTTPSLGPSNEGCVPVLSLFDFLKDLG
ncbi:putative tyrosinase-like protein tyr-3 [Bulinus truncatus]|nr:putative tyrosinase-like protein tyr-3 [Bulinus truncatus]